MAHQSKVVDPLSPCTHIYKSGRQCRQPVARLGEILCSTHIRSHAMPSPLPRPDPRRARDRTRRSLRNPRGRRLYRQAHVACQGITFRRAVSLAYMANSLINAIRLQRAEDVRTAKEPGELRIDWTGVPRLDYEKARLATQQPFRVSGFVLTNPEIEKVSGSVLQTLR
jgi:hypothetical protein